LKSRYQRTTNEDTADCEGIVIDVANSEVSELVIVL
jgi:hypothetical protein